ncbi:hypothetical protein [Colwellia psychrerythraea]|uniref:KfrA N-terminal DNA-binding domain-containing protein n=1 Tax=Colwellia psychrerythraea TaxID=28229 RepID=A0A099KZI4_COLPS|nr:hypothetical protein [Colwellia psychrerythraea]KGJ96124.1 hypothetical protein GAB14E_0071 [Colwellia psychrerythraea]
MTIIDEILICANQLANDGKKPTVALVKAKLSQRAPLATLITTLKNWQHQPDFITPKIKGDGKIEQDEFTNNSSALLDSLIDSGAIKKVIQQSLDQELAEIKNELITMQLQIKHLTEQLNTKDST